MDIIVNTDLIAKAALAYFDNAPKHIGLGVLDWVRDTQGAWNPEHNSGDSFDLMVKLNLNVFFVNGVAHAMESESDASVEFKVYHNGNPKAAMRMAILKVAASIGTYIAEAAEENLQSNV